MLKPSLIRRDQLNTTKHKDFVAAEIQKTSHFVTERILKLCFLEKKKTRTLMKQTILPQKKSQLKTHQKFVRTQDIVTGDSQKCSGQKKMAKESHIQKMKKTYKSYKK